MSASSNSFCSWVKLGPKPVIPPDEGLAAMASAFVSREFGFGKNFRPGSANSE
jgi:hypothetical protein